MWGDVDELIEFASFLIWVFYGSAVICLLVLRKTQPDTPRPYKVPLILPAITLGVAVFLSITPMCTEPPAKYYAALGFITSGLIVYIPFVYYKYRPKLMGKFKKCELLSKIYFNLKRFFCFQTNSLFIFKFYSRSFHPNQKIHNNSNHSNWLQLNP